VGQPPTARVSVVVSLGTLLGEEHGVGEVPGYGFISGDHARQRGCQVLCVSGVGYRWWLMRSG
jgi:hypothetical protein